MSVYRKMAVTVGGTCLAGVVPAPQPHLQLTQLSVSWQPPEPDIW